VRGKLVAMILALLTSALVLATTLALVGGSRLVESLAEEIFGRGAPNVAGRFLYLIGTVSLLVFTVAVYHFGPNAPRRRFLSELPGAFVAVALWVGVNRLFALYVENFGALESVYGALAGAAIYLIFLFLTCVALLIGAEVNEQIIDMRAHRGAREPAPVP
jgi:membrane protein